MQRSEDSMLPAQPFFSTPQQRLALARQRYFEEGVRPSGLLGEALIQSWARCLQARRSPHERVAFDPVTASRTQRALQRSRLLLRSAAGELSRLESTLAGTACTAILTDARGVVVHAIGAGGDADAVLLPLAGRVGVDLAEEQVGTTAPGLTLRTGQSSIVLGAEHFFGCLQVLYCAAAPIRDVHGQLAGVLDISTESRPFGFDAAAVVNTVATTIENRLLRAQSTEHVVVHLQTAPALLGTPMEGLAGLDAHGRVAWVNAAAARLLGLAYPCGGAPVEHVFGLDPAALARLTRRDGAQPHRLPSGLAVWLAARLHARDGAGPLVAAARPAADAAASRARAAAVAEVEDVEDISDVADIADVTGVAEVAGVANAADAANAANLQSAIEPSTLRDTEQRLVARTLQACGGNVSQAARTLGVSRGLIYRHMKGRQPRRSAASGRASARR